MGKPFAISTQVFRVMLMKDNSQEDGAGEWAQGLHPGGRGVGAPEEGLDGLLQGFSST